MSPAHIHTLTHSFTHSLNHIDRIICLKVTRLVLAGEQEYRGKTQLGASGLGSEEWSWGSQAGDLGATDRATGLEGDNSWEAGK